MGRRDIPFWRDLAVQASGPVLELGCGTGRIALPLGRAGVRLVGVDRSEPMLARARARVRRAKLTGTSPGGSVSLVRGDIRHLPFPPPAPDGASARGSRPRPPRAGGAGRFSGFAMVMAPYGVLQSLLQERDLAATLEAVNGVLQPVGMFGLELVADLPSWEEYRKRVSLDGWRGRKGGTRVTLVETVRQDKARRRTIFDQTFTERRGGARRVRRFSLTFRTLSVPQMARRLAKAGFEVTALLGDYRGGPWDPRAEVWVVLARKC
jgi:SAM-dependent methyltransferase